MHWPQDGQLRRSAMARTRASKVVDQIGSGEQVERCKAAVASGVVVVAVDRKDRQLDIVVGVLKVDSLIPSDKEESTGVESGGYNERQRGRRLWCASSVWTGCARTCYGSWPAGRRRPPS